MRSFPNRVPEVVSEDVNLTWLSYNASSRIHLELSDCPKLGQGLLQEKWVFNDLIAYLRRAREVFRALLLGFRSSRSSESFGKTHGDEFRHFTRLGPGNALEQACIGASILHRTSRLWGWYMSNTAQCWLRTQTRRSNVKERFRCSTGPNKLRW